jgi:type IV fimbrial biogenesis protein FimT
MRPVFRQNGVTLIELVFALAAVAVIAAFASRLASGAIHAARSNNAVSSLFASLTRARSFAATAGVDVVLCPSSDGATCAAGYHWEGGWIAFPATHAGSNRTPDEPILVRQGALPPKVHLITSTGRRRVRFQPSGGNAGSNVTYTICDGRGARSAAAYAMANNGTLHAVTVDPPRAALACSIQ